MDEINIGFYDSIAAERGIPTKISGVRVSMSFIPRWLEDMDKSIAGRGATSPYRGGGYAGPRELRLIYEAIDRTFCMLPGDPPADYMLCCYLDSQSTTLDRSTGMAFYCDSSGHILDAYCTYWENENLWIRLTRLSKQSIGRFVQTYRATFKTFETIAYINADDLGSIPGDAEEDPHGSNS